MKAISLTQPWAQLMALGAKEWETRSWSTTYRGPILIHAAVRFPPAARDDAGTPHFRAALGAYGITEPFPRGCVVAIGDLTDCLRVETAVFNLSSQERLFGDYSPGRFAFRIEGVKPLTPPITCRGALGIFELTFTADQVITRGPYLNDR